MVEFSLVLNLVVAMAAALVAGGIVQRLGYPAMIGYLLAGIAIGPHALGFAMDAEQVKALANLGVVFLMFALGTQFTLAELRRVGPVALYGGILQMVATAGVGILVASLLGLALREAVFFGWLIAFSSTLVIFKLLSERGELDSLHGRVAIGIAIVQDLSMALLIAILPASAAEGPGMLAGMGLAVAKAALLLAATYFLGTRLVPWVLERVVGLRSRELFLLVVVFLALGAAFATELLGLSFAFGAFIAGLIVSESEFSHQALAQIGPLRDIFGTLFFVSVGMLINPGLLLSNAGLAAAAILLILLAKPLITALVVRVFRYPLKVALLTGLALAQIGEFSFVLANLGISQGLISVDLYTVALAGALVSIVLSPLLVGSGPAFVGALSHLGRLRPLLVEEASPGAEGEAAHHVVIGGYGRIGRELARALDMRSFRYLVVELDPRRLALLRKQGIPYIYGDLSSEAVLARLGLRRARLLAITFPDVAAAEVAIRNARRINPALHIIARAQGEFAPEVLLGAGAGEVVQPQAEAGLEFVRHALHRFGVSSLEIQALISWRRAELSQSGRPEP